MKVLKPFIPYIIIAILVIIIYFLWNKEPNIVVSNFQNPIPSVQMHYQDDKGKTHLVMPADPENKILRKDFKNPNRPSTIVDSSAKILKLALRQIEYVKQENVSLRAENLILKQEKNPEGKIVYAYSDKNVKAKFTPPADSSSTDGILDFSYNADLFTTQYWKRTPPIIGRKKSYIDIFSPDDRLTINGVKRYSVEQKSPEFGLRVQLRTIYSLNSRKVYLGPGISFDFKRFNILGYSYYNTTDKYWSNVVGVNYDLIRF